MKLNEIIDAIRLFLCKGTSIIGRKYKAYMSHPIRGIKGDLATKEEQLMNSAIARDGAIKIRNLIKNLDIYCPGDAEEFVCHTYTDKLLTDDQILYVDCKILSNCDFVMVYEFDKLGHGCCTEINRAKELKIPIFKFKKVDYKTISELRKFVYCLEKGYLFDGFMWVVN